MIGIKVRAIGVFLLAASFILTLSLGTVYAAASSTGITLTVSRWAGPHADAMRDLLKEFERETGIKVILDAIAYENLHEKQVLELSSGTGAYDVIWVPEVWIPEYAGAGWLLPIDNMVSDPKMAGSDLDLADFIPSILNTAKYNHKLYGFPTFVQTPLLVYRTDLFKKAGFDAPTTWDDTLKAAQYFHKNGPGGIALPAKRGAASVDVWAAFLRAAGGDYFSGGMDPQVNSNAGIAATEFWVNLGEYAPKASAGWHWDEAATALAQGQVAMGITMSGIASWFVDPNQTRLVGKFGFVPLPKKVSVSGTLADWNWCISKDSKNPNAAFKLIKWLTSKDTERKLAIAAGSVGARASFYKDAQLVGKLPWLPAMLEALKNARTQPLIPQSSQIVDIMALALSSAYTGTLDVVKALNQANRDIANIVKR
ncbi:MAG: extracellular solute-binding protein [Firmicutes bacterium]|nr:extracellular solute-binding protein [Bacillota bacterium]